MGTTDDLPRRGSASHPVQNISKNRRVIEATILDHASTACHRGFVRSLVLLLSKLRTLNISINKRFELLLDMAKMTVSRSNVADACFFGDR